MSGQHQHDCFNKNEIHEIGIILKSFLALMARKNCFYFLVWETETLLILSFSR